METELTAEETIKMLEELYEEIPRLIILIKLGQLKRPHVGPHVDVHQDAVVESVHAQGHPEIQQNTY
ncbi:unnamed protein product [marine sediment metagenome]|uniref:Uncharacterized protein n=1 Tax=marine sediment metagenome TaxID=412755 RepID=X1L843_9ZZZZ